MAFLMYISVIMSVTVLRFKAPDARREFRVIFPTAGPIIASTFMIFTLIIWTANSNNYTLLISSLSILTLGIPVYLLLEMYYNKKTITLMHDITAYLMLWTENFFIPKSTRSSFSIIHRVKTFRISKLFYKQRCCAIFLLLPK